MPEAASQKPPCPKDSGGGNHRSAAEIEADPKLQKEHDAAMAAALSLSFDAATAAAARAAATAAALSELLEEEKAQLTAKGGDAVAGMGGPRRPAAQAGVGTATSFSLRRGLGLLEDGLNAAALGAEAIESDVPGKQFIDAAPDGTDGSCARSEDGTPSGFAELPSMGLISWRFN